MGAAHIDPSAYAERIALAIKRDLSDDTHVSAADPTVLSFTRNAYEKNLLKKFKKPSDKATKEMCKNNAFAKFAHLLPGLWEHNVSLLQDASYLTESEEKVLKRASLMIKSCLGPLYLEEWFDRCRHGNGVTVGTRFEDTAVEPKFTFPLSCTRPVASLFTEYLQYDDNLAESMFWLNRGSSKSVFSVVEGSRATTVPKDNTIDRLIAIEPTLNMFFQQGLMVLMYEKMRDVSLDVRFLPTKHIQLAADSSVTGLLATVDFSSASDCVTIGLARRILPPDWFEAFWTCRSPTMSVGNQQVELPMISTMGNATTFPIETLVFWSLAVATVMEFTDQLKERRGRHNRLLPLDFELDSVSVFGDDCILPTYACEKFIGICQKLGFSINIEKSFWSGRFRESCGGDFLTGRDTRPLFIRAPTDCRKSSIEAWLYTIFNSACQKYITYFGPLKWVYEKSMIQTMLDIFSELGLLIRPVPSYMPEESGLRWTHIDRISRHYDAPLSRPYSTLRNTDVASKGTMCFSYVHFEYKKKIRNKMEIRYWLALRRMALESTIENRPSTLFPTGSSASSFLRNVRRIGGYRVASGYSSSY